MNLYYVLPIVSALVLISAIAAAWRAIRTARTPQGAVGWTVFLLAAPYFALVPYLFLGHHRYRYYEVSRRHSARIVEESSAFAMRYAPQEGRTEIDTRPFEKLAALGATRGNDMKLLIDGDATFEALFAAIDAAEHYVLIQFFIVRDDRIGRALAERLSAAAARGVDVRLLFDPVGSRSLPNRYIRELQAAGVKVPDHADLRRRGGRFQINYRNHRKTLIVDGKQGFTGGFNLGDEYLGRDPAFGPWRDTFVRLSGPVVAQLQVVFAEDWHWATQDTLIDDLHWEPDVAEADMTGLLLASGPADEMETGLLFFLSAIVAARHRIWISSPYFVPDTDILSALKQAALRGVDVRILVPDSIDHRLPWLAAFAIFDECRAAGVQFWRYKAGFMHQKAVLVDDGLAALGSMNLDSRSFRLNFEAMAMLFDTGAASAVADMLETDFARSEKLDKSLSDQPLGVRIGAPVARLFAPLL